MRVFRAVGGQAAVDADGKEDKGGGERRTHHVDQIEAQLEIVQFLEDPLLERERQRKPARI